MKGSHVYLFAVLAALGGKMSSFMKAMSRDARADRERRKDLFRKRKNHLFSKKMRPVFLNRRGRR